MKDSVKVGDLVQRAPRKTGALVDCKLGIVLSVQIGGRNPVHPTATVFYPVSGKTYDIAVSLIKVISKSE
jgi:hypothetical protein